jgi:hypothetical protein
LITAVYSFNDPLQQLSVWPLLGPALVGGDWTGAVLMGPFKLPTAAWPKLLGEFMPVFRIRLPELSRAFDTPTCASAKVLDANVQKIANMNRICPRCLCGSHNRTGCLEMHPIQLTIERS